MKVEVQNKRAWVRPEFKKIAAGAAESSDGDNNDGSGNGFQGS